MKRFALIAVIGLAACADEPVGQSFVGDPFLASADQQPGLQQRSADVAAMQAAIAARQAELAAQRQTTDRQAALVASLEAAIDNADQVGDPNATMASVLPAGPETIGDPAPLPLAQQVDPSAVQPQIVVGSDGTISDNSFGTVTERETIESDAERLARLQQNTVVLQAEPLPERDNRINLAAFALSTSHRVGERVYRRTGSRADSNAARECRRFPNPDEAQRDFLSNGGPERDLRNIDPDGDGFVCGWTPDQYRALKVGG